MDCVVAKLWRPLQPEAVIHHRDISIYLDEAHTSDTNGPLFFVFIAPALPMVSR